MPFIQKQETNTSLMKQCDGRMKASVYSCTESSNGSLSDDSVDTFQRRQNRIAGCARTSLPLGTLVKKVRYLLL
jgi:hypothetical protein